MGVMEHLAMSGGGRRDMNELVKKLRSLGITVEQARRGGHYKADCPGGPVFLSLTPSDRRAIKQAKGDL